MPRRGERAPAVALAQAGVSALRLGTRSSPLALVQARAVAAAIGATQDVEIVTSSDRPSGDVLDKSRWVAGIEWALLDGSLDLAVHSAKDVPFDLPDGLELIGAPVRADARDALCGSGVARRAPGGGPHRHEQPAPGGPAPGAAAGPGRLRPPRQRGHAAAPPGGRRLRGDRPGDGRPRPPRARRRRTARRARPVTRAGLSRARGAERGCRGGRAIAGLRDTAAEAALRCERAVVGALGAGCHTPLGVHAVTAAGGGLSLRAFVGRDDGTEWIRDELVGADPVELGRALARRLLAAGAGEML